MATPGLPALSTGPDTLITIKVAIDGVNRKFKLPLRDMAMDSIDEKLRSVLCIPSSRKISIERFSDSSSTYIVLDKANPPTYKQLYRAAKAKLKLRLRVTYIDGKRQESISNETVVSLPPPRVSIPGLALPTAQDARARYIEQISGISRERELGRRMKEAPAPHLVNTCWQVCCNNCDKPMADAHFHCSICDNGDFDLCESCVDLGITCQGEGHWLIKRFIKNGNVVNSTTERIAPSKNEKKTQTTDMPGAFVSELKSELVKLEPRRTCNACVTAMPESLLITCADCNDYDLCIPCHLQNEHGHHPGHLFVPISEEKQLSSSATKLLNPGRNICHAAKCDGCNSTIYGIRHKCSECPDWDFCSSCYNENSAFALHIKQHRFIPIYEPLSSPKITKGRHYGVYCDGPLCNSGSNQTYIQGIRYKCAICHDLDFCANCEAHPDNKHNQSHPLIKFKSMVRDVRVTTFGENDGETPMVRMGDQPSRPTYTKSWVGTVAPGPLSKDTKVTATSDKATQSTTVPTTSLDAHFERETVVDGTMFTPGTRFTQTWTVKNPGPHAWPPGCRICAIGGDSMLDVDLTKPTSVADLASAKVSNPTMHSVQPGESHDFTIHLRAPRRTGMCISYWRVKAPDGTPFGHKLWCDVAVACSQIDDLHPEDAQKARIMIQDLNNANARERLPKSEIRETVSLIENICVPRSQTQDVESRGSEVESLQKPKDMESSSMVFPTLETESIVNTQTDSNATPSADSDKTHRQARPSSETTLQDETQSTAPTETETDTTLGSPRPRHNEIDVLEFSDSDPENDEDTGFLTDEEYDILDASDEEALNGTKTSKA